MTHVLILKLRIAPGRDAEFETFVAQRAKKNKTTPGFERMYLLRTEAENEYRLVTWWSRLDDAQAWIRKETYALSEDSVHRGIVVGPVPHEVLEIAQQF